MKKTFTLIFMLLLCCFYMQVNAQTQFWSDNFEGSPSSGTRIPEENGGVGGPPQMTSYFRLTDGSTVSQVVPFTGKEGTYYWAGEDHNAAGTGFTASGAQGAGTDDIRDELQIEWTGINIAGKTGLSFKGLFAAASTNEPWDNKQACNSGVGSTNTDYIIVEYSIDGGTYTPLIRFFNRGSAANGVDKYLFEDTDGNGCGDGTQLTNVFGEFNKPISTGSGSTMSLRIRVYSEGDKEEWGIDNFRLFETVAVTAPTVSTTTATGIGAVKATIGGNVTADGGATVNDRGIVWGTTTNPTITDNKASNGSGTGTFSGVVSGFPAATLIHYRAFATNSAGTNYGSDLTFTTNAALTAATAKIDVSCFNGSNGVAAVTASGGRTPYTYSWSPSGGTGSIASGLTAGTYTCTITDNEATSIIRTVTVNQPTAIALGTGGGVTNASCNGGSNGTATVAPTGGTPGYTYSWAPSGGTNATATGLTAGSYTVTVTDANSCTATRNFIVTQPTAITITPASQTNVSCNGGSTGAASINLPTGGAGTYTYDWAPGTPTGDGTRSVTGLTAGAWTVTVTDANSCTKTQIFNVTQPSAIVTTAAALTNVSCNGGTNGSATVSATGGAGTYTYSWAPSGGTAASATGLAAGTYTVTVTDANSCTATRTFTVTQPTAIVTTAAALTNVSCNGGSNGSATVSATGGTGPLSYSWAPSGGTAATASGLTAGTYTVTVTDGNTCSATRTFTVTQPTAIVTTAAALTNVSCNGGSNGSATVSATGGAGVYTYSWAPAGGTAATASGLTAGTYTVTVTDVNNCTATRTFTVTQPTAIVTTAAALTNVSCNGGSNGSATVSATGGTGPLSYSWAPSGGTAATASGLTAGTYTVTVTDGNTCSATRTFTVTQPTAIVTTAAAQTNVSCNGGSNGSATVSATGGAGSYTYSWAPSGGTAASATGLTAGTYTVTVTDANSCTATRTFTVTQPPAIVTTAAALTNVSCNGGSNGSATVSATGGTGPLSYSWAPSGGTAATATGLTAGTYTVTVTDANTCSATRTFTVTQPTAITITPASQTNVACNGGSTGAASINLPTGGAGTYTYDWAPGTPTGDGTRSVTGLTAGAWTVTVTDANSCTKTQIFNVTQPSAIVTTAAALTNVSCNGGTNGSATVSATGGAGTYTYSWAPSGGTAASATGLAAGTYTVTVTDANSCTATRTFTVTQPTAIVTTAAALTNVSCNGGSNGSATVSATGGTGPLSYSWAPSGGTAATASGLTAGTYTVTVTDGNTCSTTRTFTVTQPTAIVTTAAALTNVSCNGGSNGSATVSATGGAGVYTYSWAPAGGTAATAAGLTAGTYTVTVTDVNNCTATRTFTVTQPTAIVTTAAALTNVSCNGGSNGSATVSATGGTGPLSYSWAPSGGTAATATGLTAGTYTVTVTDGNTCSATRTFTVTQPTAITITPASQTNVACNGGNTGAASINLPTGGTGSYTYDWAPGTPTGDGTRSVTGLTAGAWTVTVTDANGCTKTQIFNVTQPTAIVTTAAAQTNVSCNGGSNGTATVSATGGAGAYTYSWAPSGGTAATASGLTAGTYTVTVTDANTCTATRTFTVTQPTAIVTTAAALTNVSCNGGSNGSATVSATGGAGAYTYSWAPTGGTAPTAFGLIAGTYTVTVTDANGCTATRTFTLTQPTAIVTTAAAQTNVSCNGGSNGTATVSATGGAGAYTYSWAPSGGTAATASGLTAGTYTVTVTDGNSCLATRTFTITQPTAITITPASQTNVACNGGSTGAASINLPTGGTGSYTYDWAPGTPTGDGTRSVTGLTAGAWTVTVTDANGCTKTQIFNITQSTAIVTTAAAQTNVSCNGGINGSATVSATGGAGAYTYSWAPSGGTAASATGLAAGTYTVTVTDANGCTATRTFTLTQPTAIVTTASAQTNVSCNGGTNGSATVTATGGTGAFTYSWAPSGGTAASATGLTAGTYTVTVTDANACMATRTFTITQPTVISTTTTAQTNVSCNGGSNGTATVVATGGAGAYTYSWAPSGGTAATATGLTAGTYTVTITDANTCTATRTFTITQPTAIATTAAAQTNVSCNGGSNGSATVAATGGTGAFTYSWAPSGGTAATATGLTAGTYTVTVSDANTCTTTRTFTITQPTAIITTAAAQTNVSCNSGSNGSATVSATGGTGAYTYSWAPSGGTAASATGLTAGTYTVTVTDANTCTATRTFTITQPTAIVTTAAAQTNVSCNSASNGSATVSATGGTGAFTYSWAPSGGTAATATGLTAGTYTVTVTDANTCSATRTFTITQPTVITATAAAQTNVSCNGGANGSATVAATGGTGAFTYSWAPSGGTAATATGLTAGTYTVTVRDANLCTATRTFTITQPPVLVATAGSQTNVLCNGGSTGAATVNVTGGTGAYTYLWSPAGGTGATASGLTAGTYTVTVKDANLCQTTQSFTITQPAALAITTISLAQSHVAVAYSATINATGGSGTYSYAITAGSLPAGLTLNTTTGTISGTPTASGTFNFTVTVTESTCGQTTSKAFNIISITSAQTITFPAITTQTFGNAPVTLTATSTSGLSVAYASGNTAVATVSGNVLTITGAGTAVITASQAGGSGYDPATDVTQTLTVNKAGATLTLGNLAQTFDGTSKAATVTTSPVGLTGVSITYNGLPALPTAAGTYAVSASLTNINYTATTATGSLVIAPKSITVTADAQSKTYGDADPVFTYSAPTGSLITGDSFSGTLSRTPGETIGTYAITAGTLSAGSNYAINFSSANLTITAKGISGNFTAGNKVYDGNTSANILSRSLTGVATADAADVTLTGGTATFADANQGIGKTVTASGMTLTGAKAANYSLTAVNTTTADISSKNIDGGFTASNKVYDGTTTATILTRTLTGVLSGDVADVTVSGGTANFTNANVGTAKTVNASGFVLGGAKAANYNLNNIVATTANITAKGISGSFTADNKVYDGNTTAAILSRSLTGVVTADIANVNLTGGTATFATASVGTGKTVTAAGMALSGTQAANYTLTGVATTTANITGLAITGNFTADNKVYDGNATASILTRTLTGVLTADVANVSLTGGTAAFADANVGTAKTVAASGMTLTGTLAGNYILSSVNTTTANITAKVISGSFTADNKVYDGTTVASILTRSLTGVLTADVANVNLTGGTATFADANVGTGKTVTATGMTLSGSSAANYSLSTVATTTANISAKPITVTADAKTKVYGSADPVLTYTLSTGALATGDTMTGSLSRAAGENVGNYAIGQNTVSAGTNYIITYTGANLAITRKALVITADNKTKNYGDANPALTASYSGFVGSETAAVLTTPVTLSTTAVAGSPAGSYPITASAAVAANYSISYVAGTLTVNKTAQTITFAALANKLSTDAIFTLTATASSNLTVSYTSSNPAVARIINGNQVEILRAGVINITASQAGDANYLAASNVVQSFTVIDNPAPIITITSSKGNSVSKGETAILTATGAVTYQWSNASGIISGQTTAALTVRPSQTTTYTITGFNQYGRSSTQSFTLEVRADYQVLNIMNVLTPNGDGKNDTWVVENIDMYPNNTVRIFDRAGKSVFEMKGYDNSWGGTLKGALVPEGAYYYIIDFGPGVGVRKGYITVIGNN